MITLLTGRFITTFVSGQKYGTWLKIHDYLRDRVRVRQRRHPAASAGILDSQSATTATMINQEVGYDAGKKIKGSKQSKRISKAIDS